jgi:RNA polymerase sigma-70 factor, ECF subfamily
MFISTVCYDSAINQAPESNFSAEELERLRSRLRYKVAYEVGFASPDVDDIVQESLSRFLIAQRADKVQNREALGAFLNGICRNVISEYRRRNMREDPMPEVAPEPKSDVIQDTELFEIRQAIAQGLDQLSERDRHVLRGFYLEEKSKEEILLATGLTDENFRVVLCRAKERFRAIYVQQTQHRRPSSH